ncbi:MAG: TVP38/TMEM64 family protein [Halobacteriales archaeon]|nr:TVP38/TMEM64 family protein [Halobacteriales archaeon]
MKIFASRTSRWKVLAATLVISVGFVALYLAARRYAPFFFNAVELRAWLAGFGIWAPIVFIALQALQVVVAPIPGQAMAVVAGYLFGSFWGLVYSLTGVMIGSAVAFSLTKRYGRPAVERFIEDDVLASFDGLVEQAGLLGLFVFVLIPGLPDDVVCFVAGLTPLRLGPFLLVLLLGRTPAYALATYAGGQFATGELLRATLLLVVFVGLSAAAYYHREAIQQAVRRG